MPSGSNLQDTSTPRYSLAMNHEPDLQATADMLSEAGLVEEYVNQDGKPALRLSPKGAQLGRALAMAGDDADPQAVLEALLGERA